MQTEITKIKCLTKGAKKKRSLEQNKSPKTTTEEKKLSNNLKEQGRNPISRSRKWGEKKKKKKAMSQQ